MTALFLKLLGMSIMGSVVILVTMLVRFILRRRSKGFIMILWAVVAIRLLIPVSIESRISIFNYLPFSCETIVHTADEMQTAALTGSNEELLNADADLVNTAEHSHVHVTERTMPDIRTVAACVWFSGMACIAAFYAVRFFLLKRRLKGAVKTGSNIYESEKVTSPFVFGFFVPKIYLPDVLNNTERECVLRHEKTHIKHLDWIKKLIGLVAVTVHWFNPLVWLAYYLFEQDIEMSCDEAAVKDMDQGLKQAYAMSIVSFAKRSNNMSYLVTSLGFSRNSFCKVAVTGRVKNIVNHKKGTVSATVAITMTMLLVAASCGFSAKTNMFEKSTQSAVLSSIGADGFRQVSEEKLFKTRSLLSKTGVYLDAYYYNGSDEEHPDKLILFEKCDTRDIAEGNGDFTERDYLRYYLREKVGITGFYVKSEDAVTIGGVTYTRYVISCCESGNEFCKLYVSKTDKDHYSDIFLG